MKQMFTTAVVLLLINLAKAQHQELSEMPATYKETQVALSDSTTILSTLMRCSFNGHLRYYFMHTNNQMKLTDYFANAAGGG